MRQLYAYNRSLLAFLRESAKGETKKGGLQVQILGLFWRACVWSECLERISVHLKHLLLNSGRNLIQLNNWRKYSFDTRYIQYCHLF